MRAQLLFQLFATALANKFMPTITLPKFGRAQPARINQPSKNDKYSVTKNTTRVVVLKVPHSGSTWFAALLNRFPRSYVKEESITKTRSNNVNPSAIQQHVGTSLIRPTDKMVASRNGKHAFSPRAKNFDCGGCELALLGLTMCPMRSEPPYDFPRGVPAAIFHQTVKFRTIFWARTNVVKMSFASSAAGVGCRSSLCSWYSSRSSGLSSIREIADVPEIFSGARRRARGSHTASSIQF